VKGIDASWRHLLESVIQREGEREKKEYCSRRSQIGEEGLSSRYQLSPKDKEGGVQQQYR
jgi:hypothetical protein